MKGSKKQHIKSLGRIFGSLLLLVSSISTAPFAAQSDQQEVGEIASPFLEENPSVRMTALGGDQVSAHGTFGSSFSNPAGLSTLSIPEIWVSHNESFLDTQTNSIGIGFPFRKQSLGFAVQYYDRGEEERIDIDESNQPVRGLGEFNFSTTLLRATWAKTLTRNAMLGIGVKGWNDNFDGASQSSWAADVGYIYQHLFSFMDVGVAAKNLGPSVDGFDLPRSYQAGFTMNWLLNKRHIDKISLFSEVDGASYRDVISRTGIELKQKYFSLRSGYESLSENVDDSLGNFTFGLGVRLKGWQIDYALLPKGNLGDQHRVSLTVGLGLTPEEKSRAARELDLAMQYRIRQYAKAHMQKAKQASVKGYWKVAVDEYEKVLEWEPNHKEAKQKIEVARHRLKLQTAEQTFRQGQKLFHQKQWLDAASYFQQTLKVVPSHKQAKRLLKKSKRKMNKSRRAMPKEKNKTDAAFNRGVRYYMDGHYSSALAEWKRVSKVTPSRPHLREYIEKAEKMKLRAELELVRGKNLAKVQTVETLSKKAYTLYSLNRFDEAIFTWESILTMDPNNKDARVAMKEAKARKELYRHDKNAPQPRRVEELNSEAMSAYVSGRLGEAANIWRKALIVDPSNRRVRNNLERVEKEIQDQEAKK